MKYKWLIPETVNIPKEFLNIAFQSEIIARLLINRGVDSCEKAKSYLYPEFYSESSPAEIPELLKAKDRILEAINKKEKITIYGDYDVDGVTSTACLLYVISKFTDKIDFYIPSRITEGYGLNSEAVKTMSKKHKTNLLITCDCGITNHKEVELANSLGIDVIVTDHHSLPEVLPPACAVLNPKLLPVEHNLHFLPGVGVAYKLAEEIINSLPVSGLDKSDLLDFVVLGMIADLAPLMGENRYLVQIGLAKLAGTSKIGLKELLRICGCYKQNGESSTNVEQIGFGIAPRINAVGRLADAAQAVKLLITSDLFEAVQIACELESQNRQRQTLCEETLKEADTLISEQVDLKSDKCIVLAKEGWHHGVVGIVASRIVEKYSLPTLLMAIDKEQNIARGSGRSVEKLNMVDSLIANSSCLEKFGGHKAACGLSIKSENIEKFISEYKNYLNNTLSDSDVEPRLKIDGLLPLSSLDMNLMNKIYKLSPFGLGNPLPLFIGDEVQVCGIRNIGKNNQHLKVTLREEGSQKTFEGLIWNYNFKFPLNVSNKIKIAYTPKLNSFNGETSIQLEIKDWQVIKQKAVPVREKTSINVVKLYDFRSNEKQCLDLLNEKTSVVYFSESRQEKYLPMKTFSRNSINKQSDCLVFLDSPPDEFVFLNVIKRNNPKEIYFVLSDTGNEQITIPQFSDRILKRLSGMLKYAVSNKNSKIYEKELLAALGINKNTLAYALEILSRIGFVLLEREDDLLSVNISTPSRQSFDKLIEYNLLLSELKQILEFKEWLFTSDMDRIKEVLNIHSIKSEIISDELRKVLV